jgi:hypothetical protein
MPKAKQRTPDDPKQSKRFIEVARDAGTDETKRGADRAFKKIASAKARRRTSR